MFSINYFSFIYSKEDYSPTQRNVLQIIFKVLRSLSCTTYIPSVAAAEQQRLCKKVYSIELQTRFSPPYHFFCTTELNCTVMSRWSVKVLHENERVDG